MEDKASAKPVSEPTLAKHDEKHDENEYIKRPNGLCARVLTYNRNT